jgi:hypothetical protein
MKYSNEGIARAAGLEDVFVSRDQLASDVDWINSPGACATWLLPVLEKRLPWMSISRDDDAEKPWFVYLYEDKETGYCDTWHEAVIEAIMATATTTHGDAQ